MKSLNKIIKTVLILIFSITLSCDSLNSKCDDIQEKELALLIDISDKELYKEIKNDITANFTTFMKDSPYSDLDECETFKMIIGNFSGIDQLDIKKEKIGIDKKGLSLKDKTIMANPKPIVDLLKSELNRYTEMSTKEKYNSSTNIAQTIIKMIISMGDLSDNTLLISSDMIINNKVEGVNFYKSIPKDVSGTINQLIGFSMLKGLEEKLVYGSPFKVIIVLKSDPKNKVNKKEVRAFWIKAFEELGVKDYLFIDNLTNKITWD